MLYLNNDSVVGSKTCVMKYKTKDNMFVLAKVASTKAGITRNLLKKIICWCRDSNLTTNHYIARSL